MSCFSESQFNSVSSPIGDQLKCTAGASVEPLLFCQRAQATKRKCAGDQVLTAGLNQASTVTLTVHIAKEDKQRQVEAPHCFETSEDTQYCTLDTDILSTVTVPGWSLPVSTTHVYWRRQVDCRSHLLCTAASLCMSSTWYFQVSRTGSNGQQIEFRTLFFDFSF